MWKSPRQLAESYLVILVASFASEGLDKPEQEDALRQQDAANCLGGFPSKGAETDSSWGCSRLETGLTFLMAGYP